MRHTLHKQHRRACAATYPRAMSRTRVVNLFAHPYQSYVGKRSDGSDPREVRVGDPGFLGNPFEDGTGEDNYLRFKHYFLERVDNDRRFRLAVLSLYGRNLGCVCEQPCENCHANVIVEWIDAHYKEYVEQFGAPAELLGVA